MVDFLLKYKPKSISEVVGNRKQMEEALKFIKEYKKGQALLLYGPSGVGKTLCAELIAKELNYELIELSSSDFRDYESIKRDIFEAGKQRSIFGKGKLILIDEIEIKDKGMIKAILELIRSSEYPVILTSNNPWEKSLLPIRQASKLIKFEKIKSEEIKRFLEKIAKKEKIKYEERALEQLARLANGDIRAAIIDLSTLNEVTEESVKTISTRELEQTIFDTLKIIFKTKNIETAKLGITQSEKEPEEIFLWIEENLPKEYSKEEDLAKAFEYLAKADFFYSMIIKRQNWALEKYFIDFLSFVSIAKKETYRKFVPYTSPKFLYEKKIPEELMEACKKIGRLTHCSSRDALSYLPIFKGLIKKNENIANMFTKEEIEAIKEFKS
ncbi:MAG: replication factor C large subunit [Candidatus Aenigmarchaeota archaeon]|nr:replication factor C large subunit [Candidatus Aenigmarchaeota archaeon]